MCIFSTLIIWEITLQSSDLMWGINFVPILSLSLHSSSPTFKLLSMASYGGVVVLDSSSPWRGISNHIFSFSIPLPLIFKKQRIDEEDPRPTISTWSYISLFCCVLWNLFYERMIVACWTIFSWFSKEISGMVFVMCWVQLFPGENNCSQWVYLCDLTMILYQFALLETYSEIEVVVVLRVRTLKSVVYWPNGLW